MGIGRELDAAGADVARQGSVSSMFDSIAHDAYRQREVEALVSSLIHHLTNLDGFTKGVNRSKINLVMVLVVIIFGRGQINWVGNPLLPGGGPVAIGRIGHATTLWNADEVLVGRI